MKILILLSLLASYVLAIPTISTKGSKFFTSDGDQYFLKGVPNNHKPPRRTLTDWQSQVSLTNSSPKTRSSTTTSASLTLP